VSSFMQQLAEEMIEESAARRATSLQVPPGLVFVSGVHASGKTKLLMDLVEDSADPAKQPLLRTPHIYADHKEWSLRPPESVHPRSWDRVASLRLHGYHSLLGDVRRSAEGGLIVVDDFDRLDVPSGDSHVAAILSFSRTLDRLARERKSYIVGSILHGGLFSQTPLGGREFPTFRLIGGLS